MAWTGDPVWLADVLRAEGLNVIEHDGWRQRGHGDFLDIRGVLCHHTAGGGPNDWRIVQNGRPDLPGPLAQLVLERDGTYRVIAVGVCWHAGRGAWPGWPTNNANFHTIGIEAVNNGVGQPWPDVQLDAYKRGCAAILRRVGLDAGRCVAHREYSSEGKIDPAGIDMAAFRRDVQALIQRGPTGDDDMPSAKEIADAILAARPTQPDGSTDATVGELLTWTDKHAADTLDQLCGPGTKDQRGALDPARWDFLGDRSVPEALGLIGAALEIPGFRDPLAGKK
ncbi:N-acetylmuramoyl-L-alanine amidase [Nocardia cyriacigeorgica]|uniref:peptidoglycan recognition protein family protein n=1 Tax=Nocardia cyriacigeorgica TaxID=135487 RepID=UPI001895B259|nr:N-acetylmuramoyl-L-alanine amidase [Nocardia cyriacigeorgica]MBF6399794.1 N-acetylmuramoyl-L-alanine amidase [Nocardia cyriacigeorgica]MBF6405377.1 N-acetylmuramoyl-L-alanine amidase [Nocardia cyriacigeorgica]